MGRIRRSRSVPASWSRSTLDDRPTTSKTRNSIRKVLVPRRPGGDGPKVALKKRKSLRRILFPTRSPAPIVDPKTTDNDNRSLRSLLLPAQPSELKMPVKKKASLRKILVPNPRIVSKQVLGTEITVDHMKHVIKSRPALRQKRSISPGEDDEPKRKITRMVRYFPLPVILQKVKSTQIQFKIPDYSHIIKTAIHKVMRAKASSQTIKEVFQFAENSVEQTLDENVLVSQSPCRKIVQNFPDQEDAEIPLPNCNPVEIGVWRKKVNTSVGQFRFSKEDLSRIVVIGTVSNKFIAAKLISKPQGQEESQMLVLFDQHAVHERILLERLMNDCWEENADGEKSIVSLQIPAMRMEFPEADVRIMDSCERALSLAGLWFQVLGPTTVNISAVPPCFIDKVNKESTTNRLTTAHRLIRCLVEEQIQHFMETSGTINALPETIMNILRSQACKTAVKFGDYISPLACTELIDELKQCKVPFQCAHGRPLVVPLLDLKNYTE